MGKLIRLITPFIIFLCASTNSWGQEDNTKKYVPQITLFADAGIKFLSFNNLSNELRKTNNLIPSSSYVLGASTYFNLRTMLFGLEFNNSFGNISNTNSSATYNGLSLGGQVGYKVFQNKCFTLAPILSFSTTENTVSVIDETSTKGNNARQSI